MRQNVLIPTAPKTSWHSSSGCPYSFIRSEVFRKPYRCHYLWCSDATIQTLCAWIVGRSKRYTITAVLPSSIPRLIYFLPHPATGEERSRAALLSFFIIRPLPSITMHSLGFIFCEGAASLVSSLTEEMTRLESIREGCGTRRYAVSCCYPKDAHEASK